MRERMKLCKVTQVRGWTANPDNVTFLLEIPKDVAEVFRDAVGPTKFDDILEMIEQSHYRDGSGSRLRGSRGHEEAARVVDTLLFNLYYAFGEMNND